MGKRAHVLAVSYPAQGHIRPLMKLSQRIADRGVKVTFVSTEFIHDVILAASPEKGEEQNRIEMVSVPDGLEPGDDRKDGRKLIESISKVMPGHLEELIDKINSSSDVDEQITCVIAEVTVPWAIGIAQKMGIKNAMFFPPSVTSFAWSLRIPKLIEGGVIDNNGTALKNEMISLSPDSPAMSSADFPWSCPGNPTTQKLAFAFSISSAEAAKTSNWLLCNSIHELESSACKLIPNLLSMGPLLLSSDGLEQSTGSFWPEDSTCLNWLDAQPNKSVIYVAFGSTAIFSAQQFEELTLGLELVAQPTLWVVRSDLTDEFSERFGGRVKIVKWAPQEKVLAHPSIACFLSHCGWNSTLEGLSMGVPFLCWPYFADQFLNRNYICDVWKVGLGLKAEGNGIISRHEIRRQMEMLLCDGSIRANAVKMKELAGQSISEGGSSFQNFNHFIEQIMG
ncbi:UDP-glycosyltransferase 83A1-like [Cornus florida]|uniref:UDP-glycosyltransferase 83A1-like n=1 Tax=Cornus florida TaxID=4283 RepID=UPI002898FA7B|nr:UDP-glycosyltransferase 83A1-like [Cornus florida]